MRTLQREELRQAFLVRAELESLATELATPKMTDEGLAELERAERRFHRLTSELRTKAAAGNGDRKLVGDWVRANQGFHDVIYAAADAPLVEQIAKGARRTFLGQAIWAAGTEIDELYVRNDLQHQAIRLAIAARNPLGARVLAREHVLSSGRMLEAILDQVEARQRPSRRPRTRRARAA